MVRPGAKNSANAVGHRHSLLLSTAVVALVTAVAGLQPAGAQAVSGSGVNPPGITSPNWSVGGDLRVGQGTTLPGTLTITGGGTVDNDTGFIGFDAGSQGTVTVSGQDGSGNASTWTNNGDLVVGQGGIGTLFIEDGGKVSNVTGYIGAEFAGAGTHSDVTVSGHDASGNASTWTITGQLNVGDNGAGTLTIQDGGMVNTGANAVVGLDSDSSGRGVGSVLITGRDANGNASTLNVTGNLAVGNDAQDNRLDILNGGVLNTGAGTIGDAIGSQGTATVSGRDASGNASAWNSGNIYVGYQGNGTLSVEDGAAVTSSAPGGGAAAVYIGYTPGSIGTLSVSSSTGNVSRLTVTDYIDVGTQGAGTLSIEKGGFVSVARDVHIGRFSGADGALHLNGDSTGRGILETGSVIRGAGLTAILDLNGGILRANRDEPDFLPGFTALTVGAEGAWFDTNGHEIAVSTDFSGSSSFNKLGLGRLTLTGDSSGFTGASTVSAGTLAVNGVLGGNMLVDTAGRLEGTGSVGNVVNTGVVAPGYAGAMGTLTVRGNYASNGGRLEIATVLGDDSSPTSRLVVDGATSGTTQVTIINLGGTGAPTVQGIKIVDVAGASNGSFVLNSSYVFQGTPAVIAGAYAYRLYQGGVSTPTDGDWYLRSNLTDPGTPSGPGTPSIAVFTPLYQPGVPIYEAYGANLQSLNTLPTLQQRVGNRTWVPGAGVDGNGMWGRTEGSHGRFQPAVSTASLDQDIDTWKMQAGMDRVLWDSEAGGRLVAGINVSYGEASGQVNSVFGNGGLSTDGYGLGATITWYGPQGFYVDGQAQVGRYNTDLDSDLVGALANDNDGSGEAFSIEVGKRMAIGDQLGITPQFQMIYSNVHFDGFVDPSGAVVTAGGNDSLRTRWGVAVDYQSNWEGGGRGYFYGIANVSYEWLDGMNTLVSNTLLSYADERFWGELGLGASVSWRKDLAFYGEVSANSPFDGFGDSYILRGNVGLRAQF